MTRPEPNSIICMPSSCCRIFHLSRSTWRMSVGKFAESTRTVWMSCAMSPDSRPSLVDVMMRKQREPGEDDFWIAFVAKKAKKRNRFSCLTESAGVVSAVTPRALLFCPRYFSFTFPCENKTNNPPRKVSPINESCSRARVHFYSRTRFLC